jgi:hypothetical protein
MNNFFRQLQIAALCVLVLLSLSTLFTHGWDEKSDETIIIIKSAPPHHPHILIKEQAGQTEYSGSPSVGFNIYANYYQFRLGHHECGPHGKREVVLHSVFRRILLIIIINALLWVC